jgi:rod shape-determining protein MreD
VNVWNRETPLMRRNLLWAAIVIAASLIQMTWLDAIRIQGVLPDLTLLLVLYFAISDGEERAMFTGVLGGLCQDVTGNAVLGHNILCNVVVGYAMGRASRRLITEHPAVKVAVVFLATVIHGILFTCIQYVQTPYISATRTILATVLPGAFYTALATPVVFYVLDRCFRTEEDILQGEAL